MNKIIEDIADEILVPFTFTFRFVAPNGYGRLNLPRIFKRLIHPFQGEAWLETTNRLNQYDPHVHLIVAVDAEHAERVKEQMAERVAAVSKGAVYCEYASEVKSWTACRQYVADQSRFRSKEGNQYIFASYRD